MKRILSLLAALTLLFGSPTVAMAKGYSGGGSYHSSSSLGSYGSRAYSSSGSSLPSSSGSGTYHSGSSSYSGGSTSRSGSTGGTYHSGYTSPSSGTRTQGGWFGNGSRGFGLSHLASFGGGFLLGSMFHPFGWGFGGGPGYGGGWGGPGYNPMWSIVGMIVDLLLVGLILWIIYRVFRALTRRRRDTVEPVYGGRFGSTSSLFRDLDEQAVVDACCELVASRHGCAPQEVSVDLTFNRGTGTFGADIVIAGRRAYPLHQQDLVDAVAAFVASRERVGTRNVDVDLQFDDRLGIHASVKIACDSPRTPGV